MATLSYQRAILGVILGEGSAIATAMIPFLLAAILISWFGLQRRKWQQGRRMTDVLASSRSIRIDFDRFVGAAADHSEGHDLSREAAKRLRHALFAARAILIVLLFPFLTGWRSPPSSRTSNCSTSNIQSVLDLVADAEAYPEGSYSKQISALALEHDVLSP